MALLPEIRVDIRYATIFKMLFVSTISQLLTLASYSAFIGVTVLIVRFAMKLEV